MLQQFTCTAFYNHIEVKLAISITDPLWPSRFSMSRASAGSVFSLFSNSSLALASCGMKLFARRRAVKIIRVAAFHGPLSSVGSNHFLTFCEGFPIESELHGTGWKHQLELKILGINWNKLQRNFPQAECVILLEFFSTKSIPDFIAAKCLSSRTRSW